MGTNYYLHLKGCDHCGHTPEPLHIGKSSGGWCFSLHVDEEKGLTGLSEWIGRFHGPDVEAIKDEYGRVVSEPELLATICERSWRPRTDTVFDNDKPFGYSSWEEFHQRNHSEPGPNNLMRHKLDGSHCVGHGDGTWDLIAGEFS